jgi:hypothetical protein
VGRAPGTAEVQAAARVLNLHHTIRFTTHGRGIGHQTRGVAERFGAPAQGLSIAVRSDCDVFTERVCSWKSTAGLFDGYLTNLVLIRRPYQ